MESTSVANLTSDPTALAAPAGKCPFPHAAMASPTAPPVAEQMAANGEAAVAGCPIMHAPNGAQRSPADMVVRRLLRISDKPAGVSQSSAQRSFQQSMMISAIRCTLTYVVFPFLAPAIGFATGVGPAVGLVIGSVAIVCDVFTVRRFFAADHKWRWHFSAIAVSVIGLLSVLLVQDVTHIIGNLTS